MVAGGQFSTAGGLPASRWALWSEAGIPKVATEPMAHGGGSGAVVTVSSTCTAGYDFSGPVSFRWMRNGTNVSNGPGGASPGGGVVTGASGFLSASATTTTLTINDVRASDAGQYSVVYTNPCGSGASIQVAVTVSSPCLADLNDDDAVNGDDLGLLLSAWGPCTGCVADLNDDGAVNGDDLGLLLSSWGPCTN
jgi:hypothetical protein